jgi:mRNA-degrading endonuclease toxin of MazEF toxin-antitoxin module
VPARGEVLTLRRAVGFLPGSKLASFAVVQADRLSAALETVIVVPLDQAHEDYAGLPALVAVSRDEAGLRSDQVAIVPQVTSLPLSRFEAGATGKLRKATLERVERALRIVLDLQ